MDTLAWLGGAGIGAAATSSVAYMLLHKKQRLLASHQGSHRLAYRLFDTLHEGVMFLTETGELHYANAALLEMFGLKKQHLRTDVSELMPDIAIKNKRYRLDEFLRREVRYQENQKRMTVIPQCELLVSHKRKPMTVTLYAEKSKSSATCEGCYTVVVHDLSEQEAQACLEHAHQLTQLPNEIQAKKDLNRIFSRIHLTDKKLAIVLLEIDNFSQIRATIGHEQAEKQLVQVAQYLKVEAELVNAQAYHMFTNVFMVVMPQIDHNDEVAAFCDKVERQLLHFYEVDNIKLHLSASIGVAVYPENGSSFMLLDNAFKALNEAQRSGVGQYKFFHEVSSPGKFDELELYHNLHKAISNEEFEVYYQPIVRASDTEVVGAEALIRWKHPEYGFVPPDLFVPMLEKSGLIVELGQYVLETVLKQLKRWEMFSFKAIQVSINMSLMELESDGFVENVRQQLEHHNVHPESIKFEITEGLAMQNEALMHQRLMQLKKLGISISLDDFGTGYTSFNYLKKIPADIVKIDRSLILNLLGSKDDERIVHAMIELGHNLDMKVVVEGVEDKPMLEKLRALGADYLQGYYFSKPLPAFEFQELIRQI